MTEEAPFATLATRDGVEFRRYASHLLANVSVSGDFGSAPTAGFTPLVRYISGDNEGRTQLAMTAPVFHESLSETQHVISFVLPKGTTRAPKPMNRIVTTHTESEFDVAAVRFSGLWSERRARRMESSLKAQLDAWHIEYTDRTLFARYDPPWKPGFLRRNEVLVVLSSPFSVTS